MEHHKETFLIGLTVNSHPMKFILDTGATCGIVGLDGYREMGSPRLKPASSQLKSYGSTNVPLKGWTNVEVKLGNKVRNLRLLEANTPHEANIFGMQ